jgi:hypothetical protein
MEEIKKIILDKKYCLVDKLIMIYQTVDKGKDWKSLSSAMGLPVEMLQHWKPVPIDVKAQPDKNKNGLTKKFIEIFFETYKDIYNRKFNFIPKEIGQMMNIIKVIRDPARWEEVMKLVKVQADRYFQNKPLRKNTWKFIIENLSPSRIYSNINFVLSELENGAGKQQGSFHGWETRKKTRGK